MNPISARLLNQQLICPQFTSPHDVVAWMGAMQGQEYNMMRWAVAMRTQSYMPAQDIHIVTNLNDRRNSPWYVFDSGVSAFDFPEWSFTPSQLKRFRDD